MAPPESPRLRKSSVVDVPNLTPSNVVPETLMFAKEEDLEEIMGKKEARSFDKKLQNDVQDLADALGEAFGCQDNINNVSEKAEAGATNDNTGIATVHDPAVKHAREKPKTISQPLTPLQAASPAPDFWSSAMPSTPKSGSIGSLRLSDADSQVDPEDSDEEQHGNEKRSAGDHSEDLQLVMPSLTMPDRRPFTERGKKMGKLRVCVAGRKASGKSSLIRAIVRQCEDIVHVDPVSLSPSFEKPKKAVRNKQGTSILEIMASTKAYPTWWTDMEESRVLKRRKSMGDTVLERNICFIDPTGHSDSRHDDIFEFIEEAFWHADSVEELTELERLHMVGGQGANVVDAVLYIFSGLENLANDVEQFNHLATLSNVIPIIGKSDLLTDDGIQAYKTCVLQQLQPSSRPFLFGKSIDDILQQNLPSQDLDESEQVPPGSIPDVQQEKTESLQPTGTLYPPFAVSSLAGFDTSEMDASLLMSSNYTPPLLSSELPSLVHHLFEPENISWLRHSAARKFLAWRDCQLSAAIADVASSSSSAGIGPLQRARFQRLASETERRASALGPLVPHRTVSAPDATTLSGRSFSSRWNTDVHIDSTVLDHVPRADRARWLLEKVHEEVIKGNIAVVDSTDHYNSGSLPQLRSSSSGQEPQGLSASTRRQGSQRVSHSSRKNRRLKESDDLPAWARQRYRSKVIDPADPLGVCNAWEGWGRAIVWGASGGIVVGVVWVVLVRGAWGWRGLAWE